MSERANTDPLGQANRDIAKALETLRETPARDSARVAAGRAAFLADAQAARRTAGAIAAQAAAQDGVVARMRRWRITLTIVIAALTGGAGAVYAAQDSLPDSPVLYGIKLASEDVRLALTFDDARRTAMLRGFADRRVLELSALTARQPANVDETADVNAAIVRARQKLAEHEATLEVLDRGTVWGTTGDATPTAAATQSTPLLTSTELPTASATQTETATELPDTPTRAPQFVIDTTPTAAVDVTRTPAPTEAATETPIPPPTSTPAPTATRRPRLPIATQSPTSVPAPRIATLEAIATRIARTETPVPPAVIATPAPAALPTRAVRATLEAVATQIAPTRAVLATALATIAPNTPIAPEAPNLRATARAIATQIAERTPLPSATTGAQLQPIDTPPPPSPAPLPTLQAQETPSPEAPPTETPFPVVAPPSAPTAIEATRPPRRRP